MDFMKVYIQNHGDRQNPPRFEAPGNIVFVTLASGNTEAFINGTQPETAAQGTPSEPAAASSPPALEE
jgi:hypothetical protein